MTPRPFKAQLSSGVLIFDHVIIQQNNIPVFSPAITDGALGDTLYFHSYKNPGLVIDIVEGKWIIYVRLYVVLRKLITTTFLYFCDISTFLFNFLVVNVILSHMKITCFNFTRLTENNNSAITTWRSWIRNPQKTYFFDDHIKFLFACMTMKYTVHNCFSQMTIHSILTPFIQKGKLSKKPMLLHKFSAI